MGKSNERVSRKVRVMTYEEAAEMLRLQHWANKLYYKHGKHIARLMNFHVHNFEIQNAQLIEEWLQVERLFEVYQTKMQRLTELKNIWTAFCSEERELADYVMRVVFQEVLSGKVILDWRNNND